MAMSFDLDDLRDRGFFGFASVRELRSDFERIPDAHGVYVVVRDSTSEPIFLEKSPAGWFKGQDPSRPITTLREKWIVESPVLYIGKAGPSRSRTLRKRISEFIE